MKVFYRFKELSTEEADGLIAGCGFFWHGAKGIEQSA
jgi:hypothetical protein